MVILSKEILMAVLRMSKVIVMLTQILTTMHLPLLKMTKAVVVIKETKLKTEDKPQDDKDRIRFPPQPSPNVGWKENQFILQFIWLFPTRPVFVHDSNRKSFVSEPACLLASMRSE